MNEPLVVRLAEFARVHHFRTKGPLCVALVVTQHAKEKGLPLNPAQLVTDGEGQVLGLGKSAVQSVLGRHGITRVLAEEGGRTSRGSIRNMRTYVAFLNEIDRDGLADLEEAEKFWVGKVLEFFAAKPFRIRMDAAKGLNATVGELLVQAEQRQKDTPGVHYVGAVLQHLVGAKLDCVLGIGKIVHNAFSTSDAQTGRWGDFSVGDVAIHVTTAPGEALMRRCHENLGDGRRPVIVTIRRSVAVAEGLADNAGIRDRVDVFEAEQFVATNLYELGRFDPQGRRNAVEDLVDRYNAIVEEFETDPSLRIEVHSQR